MATLMMALPALSQGTIADTDFALATLTHANLGEPAFGIAPADGELRVTLRTMTNEGMDRLIEAATAQVTAARGDLTLDIHWHDVFRGVVNDTDATDIARHVAHDLGHEVNEMPTPMRWSEDFGRIGDDGAKATMLYVGAGTDMPQLHNPDYDFPDALLPVVIDQFAGIVDRLLGLPDT